MPKSILGEIIEKLQRNDPSFTEIHLKNCDISNKEMRRLSDALSKNRTVHTINIYSCEINDTGARLIAEALRVNLTIHTLYLGGNQIGAEGARAIAEALKENSTILTVKLRNNEIGAEGACAISEALKVNSTIRTVILMGNQIGAEGARAIAEALKVNSTICTVNLWGNEIGSEGACAIAEALKKNSTIRTVNLGGNRIGDEGARTISEVLKVNSTIFALDLHSNEIGAEGARAIAEALKENSTVHTLDLENNQIGDEGACAIAEVLKVNSTVHTFNLANNEIGAEGAHAIAEALKVNSTLHTLNLYGNEIGAEGARAIAEALKENSTVHTLNLLDNEIGAEGARAIAEALKVNSTVHTLDLEWNRIGAEGARAIAEALKVNSTIRKVILMDNEIGAEGACAIAEALKGNSTVHTLDLENNQIGAEGAHAIAEALKVNSTVHILNLWDNEIGSEGACAIAEALKGNSTVHTLDLGCNQIGDEGARAISEVLKVNFRLISIAGFSNDGEEYYYLERNRKISAYLDLIFYLKKVALEKQLPSDEENRKIQEQLDNLKATDLVLLKKDLLSINLVEWYLKLAEIVESYLNEILTAQELAVLNQQSYGIKSSCALLRAWNAEANIENANFEQCSKELMASIPEDHPLRGEAHARAADLLTRKINNLTKKEKTELLSESEIESVLVFLSHCASARNLGVSENKIPSVLEDQVLKCLGNYLNGEGWGHEAKIQSAEKGDFSNPKLIEWLKRNVKKLAEKEGKLKFVAFDMKNQGSSYNAEELDEEMDVVLLENTKSELLKAFESKASQLYPHAIIITGAPVFLGSEERPFQRFLKSCLIGNLGFVGNFEHQIKEIGDRYRSKKIDLSHAKKEAKKLFLKEIKGANQFKLLFLFDFVKNNPLCDFIHKQRNERWDRSRISLFRHIARDDGDKRQTKSTQSNRWWNTATFSQIGKKIKSEWVKNERKGDVTSLDREALLDFDYGNLFKSQCYSGNRFR